MKRQRILLLGIILLVLAALAACQAGTKVTTAPEATNGSASTPGDNAPSGESRAAYPAPGTQTTPNDPQPTINPYPEPAQGATVGWDEAQKLIKNGDVTQLVQAKSLEVTITFKDGITIKTKQPALDDILNIIKECGDKCKNIKVVTE